MSTFRSSVPRMTSALSTVFSALTYLQMSFIYPAILPAARRDHPVKTLTNSQAVFAAAAVCSAPVRPIALYNPPPFPMVAPALFQTRSSPAPC